MAAVVTVISCGDLPSASKPRLATAHLIGSRSDLLQTCVAASGARPGRCAPASGCTGPRGLARFRCASSLVRPAVFGGDNEASRDQSDASGNGRANPCPGREGPLQLPGCGQGECSTGLAIGQSEESIPVVFRAWPSSGESAMARMVNPSGRGSEHQSSRDLRFAAE